MYLSLVARIFRKRIFDRYINNHLFYILATVIGRELKLLDTRIDPQIRLNWWREPKKHLFMRLIVQWSTEFSHTDWKRIKTMKIKEKYNWDSFKKYNFGLPSFIIVRFWPQVNKYFFLYIHRSIIQFYIKWWWNYTFQWYTINIFFPFQIYTSKVIYN
jgi:hypothetical protein